MNPIGNDHIAHLLRLKRYERPPPDYFENFLHEFRQRQRDEFVRQPLWRIYIERAKGLALLLNIRSLAPAGLAVMVAFVAVFSIRLYQQPDTTQVAVQSSPVPTAPGITEKESDFAPTPFAPTLDMQPTLLPARKNVLRLSPDRSDQFVPLQLEWYSVPDSPLPDK